MVELARERAIENVLDDIEARRNDAAFPHAGCARANPDPTTAGDFCDPFVQQDIWRLMTLVNDVG